LRALGSFNGSFGGGPMRINLNAPRHLVATTAGVREVSYTRVLIRGSVNQRHLLDSDISDDRVAHPSHVRATLDVATAVVRLSTYRALSFPDYPSDTHEGLRRKDRCLDLKQMREEIL
jgi:hypothetical protein